MARRPNQDSTDNQPAPDGSHDDLNVHPEHREAQAADLQRMMDAPSATEANRRNTRRREQSGAHHQPSHTEHREGDAINRAAQRANTPQNRGQQATDGAFQDIVNSNWSTEELRRLGKESDQAVAKKKKNPWKMRFAGFLVGLVISTFAVAFQQGPNFAIQHLREQLLGKLGEIPTSHSLRYRRRNISKIRDMFSRDGRRGGKVIADMQARGWAFRFNSQGDIVGVRSPYAADFVGGDLIGAEISGYMDRRWPLRSSKWKTKRMNAFYTHFRVSRRSVIARSPDADPDAVVEMRRRLASQVVPEEPDTSLRIQDSGDLDEEEQADFDSRADENEILGGNDGSLAELRQKILNGENLTPEELAVLRSSSTIDQNILRALYDFADTPSLAGRAFNAIKGFASATDIADKVCTMKNRMRAIEFAARNYRALSLLRYTMLFIGAADEIRKGEINEVDPALLGILFRQITAIDSYGNSIGSSPGFAYMLRGSYSRSRNDAFRSSVGVDGKLSGMLAAIDSALGHIPGVSRGQCRVIQNPGFQIGVAAVEVVVGFFSGGGSEAAIQAGKQGAVQALRAAVRTFISRKALIEVAESVAIDITFEGMLTLLQVYAEKATTINFTGRECCAELGDILVAGGGTSHKQRDLVAGFVPATTSEYNAVLDDFEAWKKEENQKKSWYARTFDYHNYDSLTFKTANKLAVMPYGMEGIGRGVRNGLNVASSVLTKPLSMFSGIANILSTKVGAQGADDVRFGEYELEGGDLDDTRMATDPAGNFLTILPDYIANIDPGENIEYLAENGDIEPQPLNSENGGICIEIGNTGRTECYDPASLEPVSDDFLGHIENCVEAVDLITTIENESQTDPQTDCLATQEITRHYKAHLTFIDMYDGIDGGLFPGEIGESSGGGVGWNFLPGVASGQ